jgi:ribose transport system ATP-binding protein
VILNAMFGRRATAPMPSDDTADTFHIPTAEDGRPAARVLPSIRPRTPEDAMNQSGFLLTAPDISQGATVPDRFVEESATSPALRWSGVPEGTQSFALAVTDPDLPAAFNFPRSFAHWLVHDIPGHIRALPEGASNSLAMPTPAVELNSDFVTFAIPGFGRGWGGPWPPDRRHRYVFTLYALKTARVDIAPGADLAAFAAAVLPVTIDQASFTAVYGPARKPLPTT